MTPPSTMLIFINYLLLSSINEVDGQIDPRQQTANHEGNKELLQERRLSKRSTSVDRDKCCNAPNIKSCTAYDVAADIVQSETEEISIHGYNLTFLRKVQPNGFVYKNNIGDEAVLSISANTGKIFGSLTTHSGRSFTLEKCKSGYMWIEFDLPSSDADDSSIMMGKRQTRRKRSSDYSELLAKGETDNSTMASYSIIVYYTVEFAEITEDIQGRIELTIAILNEGYANSNIPLTAIIHCIEPAYIHDKGGSELIVDLHNLIEGDMDKLRRKADAAHLLSGLTTGYGGVGWFGRIEDGSMVSYAEKNSAAGGFVSGHEIGHNIGLGHGDGHCLKGTDVSGMKFHTMMGGSCKRNHLQSRKINYYSNPDLIYPVTGTPLGGQPHETTSMHPSIKNSAKIVRDKRFALEAVGDESTECRAPDSRAFKRCFRTDITHNIYGHALNPIKFNEKLATIPFWGPTWKITFNLNVKSFPSSWVGILHFTTGENCCNVGDRIPFVKLYKDNQLVILNAVNEQGNHQTRINLEINRWYNIEISQSIDINNEIRYKILVDEEEKLNVVNGNPQAFNNVQVFSSDPWHDAADAEYQNLCFENIEEEIQNRDLNGEQIERGKLIDTVEVWGPLFRISFDLFITSFGPSEWGSILSFKGNGATDNCCNNGDRVPIVQLRDNGQLYFINSVNGKGNTYFHTTVTTNKWYKIEIEQTKMDDKVFFMVKIDDQEINRIENNDPRSFENVRIFAGDSFNEPANARFKNLQYKHEYDFVPI